MTAPQSKLPDRHREVLERILAAGEVLSIGADEIRLDDRRVPVRGGVLRFRESDDYNESFALQWNRFKTNQLDQVNGTELSLKRFRETGWEPGSLAGDVILEAGCGAGRFTRIMAEAGAELVAIDYSTAVDACRENNGGFSNVTLMQCDILDMPFRDGAFDRVFCHGVLQHTPDPEAAFRQLHRCLRAGGRLSIDIYHRDGRIRPWKSKYIWRPITTRMNPERLLRFVEWYIPKWLPIDTLIKRIPVAGNYLGAIIPCWNYFYTDLPPEQKVSWAIMDTFDALAPTFDIPARKSDVERWFRDCGCVDVEVREGGNGLVGNGVKAG